jgi:hypothetical protein
MPLQIIPAAGGDPRLQQQFAVQQIGQALGQFGQIRQQQLERQAMVDALAGQPATPGSIGAGTTFAGSPELGGQTNTGIPGTPGLLPGLDRRQIEAAVLAGAGPELFKVGVQQQFPEPISAADQARLDLQREGMDLDRQGLQLRRDQFASDQEYNRAKLALDERELAQGAATAGQAKLSDIGSFRGQYTGLSEDFIASRDAYAKLRTAADNPSAAGDVALISGYMKMIDPSSVVREGEYATAANAAGIPEQIRGYWNRLINGERLTPDQRADFARQGHGMFNEALQAQDQLQSTYRGIASRMAPNVLPDDAVPDFIGTSREWQAPAPPTGQTTAQALTGQATGAVQGAAEQALAQFGVPPVAQRVAGQRYRVGTRELLWDGSRWQE